MSSQDPVFSGEVTAAATAALDALLDRLRDGGLEHEGLFRIPGNAEDVADARKQLDAGDDPQTLAAALDLDDAAALTKLWFRSHAVVGEATNRELRRLSDAHGDDGAAFSAAAAAALDAADPGVGALLDLLRFLHDVQRRSDANKMTAKNLAICFAPNLFLLEEHAAADLPRAIALAERLIRDCPAAEPSTPPALAERVPSASDLLREGAQVAEAPMRISGARSSCRLAVELHCASGVPDLGWVLPQDVVAEVGLRSRGARLASARTAVCGACGASPVWTGRAGACVVFELTTRSRLDLRQVALEVTLSCANLVYDEVVVAAAARDDVGALADGLPRELALAAPARDGGEPTPAGTLTLSVHCDRAPVPVVRAYAPPAAVVAFAEDEPAAAAAEPPVALATAVES